MQTDTARDVEIDLQMAWNSDTGYEVLKPLPDTPRNRWYAAMNAAWDTANDVERIELKREFRHMAELESKALRAGLLPHLIGTGAGGRGRSFSENIGYVAARAGHDGFSQTVAAPPALSAGEEYQLQQRMLSRYRSRGSW